MEYLLVVDPGLTTGAVAKVAVGEELHMNESHTLDINRGDPAVPPFKGAISAVVGSVSIDRALIEFPSPTYHGKQNAAIMLGVSRVAAEIGLYCYEKYGTARFVEADSLRRNGHVIANSERPKLYERIYGSEPPSEHVCDAGLIAANFEGVL